MKKLFLFLSFLPIWSYADQVASAQFKGINNNENSVIIGPEYAQDLLNVDVTPGGKSIKKRSGYGLFKAIPGSFHGGYHFFDSTGNDVQLWGEDTILQSIVNSGDNTAIVSSATTSSTWDCADTQGSAYCVDSNRDAFIKTNGTTMSWFMSPLGTMVESTPDRVVVAGVSGSPNTLFISQSNTFTNFTTGVNATDAFTEPIASPGSKLTHIRWGCGKLLWWKDSSFGYLDFDDQYTASIKTVSDVIGTFDNTSAIDPGGRVWFRGQDGHTWMYDCSFLTKQSIDITPLTQVAGHRTSNLWAQTSASDFNAGSNVNTDTTTSSGNVILNAFSEQFMTLSAWTLDSSTYTVGSNLVSLAASNPVNTVAIATQTVAKTITPNWDMHFSFKLAPSTSVSLRFLNSSNNGYCFEVAEGASGGLSAGRFASDGCHLDVSVVAGITDTSLHTGDLIYSATGFAQVYLDGVLKGTFTNSANSGLNKAVFRIGCGFTCSSSSSFGPIYISASTGTYYSAVHNAPGLAGWSTLGITQVLNSGTETFYMRSSTNSFSILSATPSWTAQGAGSLVSVSTGTYFQFRDDFAITAATQAPTLNDFTVNWFEGTSTDQAYMIYFDNAIWEAVAYGAGQATNNYVFKYDLINEGWTIYDIPMNGMLIQNNQLYFGGPIQYIYIYGNSTSDYRNNPPNPITAFWRSKSFSGADPFLQTALTNIDIFAKKDNGTTLTSTYTTDTSTATAYSVSLSTSNTIVQSRKILPSGKMGYVFDFKLGDFSSSSSWEVFGYRIGFNQLPYRPTTP